MTYTKTGSIPTSQFIWVDTAFTHQKPRGYVAAHWVQITSIPDRAWGLNVILQDGGQLYRNVPPWAVSFQADPWVPNNPFSPEDTQPWNCYSEDFAVLECPHLLNMRLHAMIDKETKIPGRYLFQTTHLNDSYSAAPEQDKTMIWVVTSCGRLTIQPNNHILFADAAFNTDAEPDKLKLQTTIYRTDEWKRNKCFHAPNSQRGGASQR